jgi:hypothetical protein
VGESLFNRGGVAQARYCTPIIHHHPKKNTLRGMGGGEGGVCGVAQTWHCTSPIPPKEPALCAGMGGGGTGGVHRGASPKNFTASRLSPPRKNPPYYGGNRGDSPWRWPRTTLQVAYPPLEKPTIRVLTWGGGEGVFTVALHMHGTARRLSPRSPPSCPG